MQSNDGSVFSVDTSSGHATKLPNPDGGNFQDFGSVSSPNALGTPDGSNMFRTIFRSGSAVDFYRNNTRVASLSGPGIASGAVAGDRYYYINGKGDFGSVKLNGTDQRVEIAKVINPADDYVTEVTFGDIEIVGAKAYASYRRGSASETGNPGQPADEFHFGSFNLDGSGGLDETGTESGGAIGQIYRYSGLAYDAGSLWGVTGTALYRISTADGRILAKGSLGGEWSGIATDAASAVPLPSALVLMLGGLGALCGLRGRRSGTA